MEEQNERYYGYILRKSEEDKKVYMENTVQRTIWVTFMKEGIPNIPAALEDPALLQAMSMM